MEGKENKSWAKKKKEKEDEKNLLRVRNKKLCQKRRKGE